MGKLSKVLKAPLIILVALGLLSSIFNGDWLSSIIISVVIGCYFAGVYLNK